MDLKNRHPLNAINGYESISMLEALIPFVEYPLKLPLALFIKFSEIRLIINNFRSLETLCKLGLHNASNDPLDMICALTGMPRDMLKMVFSMMENNNNPMSSDLLSGLTGASGMDFSNLSGLFQNMQSGFGNSTAPTGNFFSSNQNQQSNVPFNNSDNFEQNIQNILAEYDLQQATQFDSQHTDTSFTDADYTSADYNVNSDNEPSEKAHYYNADYS